MLLLHATYPIGLFYQFSESRWATVGSYLILTAIITVLALVLAPFIAKAMFPGASAMAKGLASGFVTFLLLLVVSLSLGPIGIDPPIFNLRGIFFAEWNFVKFLVHDGIALSAISGLISWRFLR